MNETRSHRWGWHVALLVTGLLTLCPAAWSQDAPEAKAKNDELVHSAKFLKEKLDDLLVEMNQVAQLMEETEPDVAKILRQTVEHAQRQDVSEKLDRVIETLRGGLDEAAQQEPVLRHRRPAADAADPRGRCKGGVQDRQAAG